MKKYYHTLLNQIEQTSLESTVGVLNLGSDKLRSHLRENFSHNDINPYKGLVSSPVFEAIFAWKKADKKLEDYAKSGLLEKELIEALDFPLSNDKSLSYSQQRFKREWYPYAHQVHAWNSLLQDKKSIVITTGTGSGKTEAFMIPVLNDLLLELKRQNNRKLEGVQALFIYPLNSLIQSQKERLGAWTHTLDDKIRFCLYNGNTPNKIKDAGVQADKYEVKSREDLRKSPPPILITNITMLEYMLIRTEDKPILQKSQGKLKWIILDEAHSYIGSPAAELSLLLRRTLHAFGVEAKNVRFAAVSATIGDNKEAQKSLKEFLSQLADIPQEHIEIITGHRDIPSLSEKIIQDKNGKNLEELETLSEAELFDNLETHPVARNIRKYVAEISGKKAVSLEQLQNNFSLSHNEILRWLDICSIAKKGEIPFLPLRGHIFHRTLNGLWACINPNCSKKIGTKLEGDDWKFGYVYNDNRQTCDCGSPIFSLTHCGECQTEFLEAILEDNKFQQISEEKPDDFRLIEDEDIPDEDIEEEASIQTSHKKIISHTNFKDGELYSSSIHPQTAQEGGEGEEGHIPIYIKENSPHKCPACQHGKVNKPAFRNAYLGSPFYISHTMPTLLEHCNDYQNDNIADLPFRGRRLITFTDSRQGTARMSIKMQQDSERQTMRGLIYHILGQASKGDEEEIQKIEKDIKKNRRLLEFEPDDTSIQDDIKELEEKKQQKLQKSSLSWEALSEELSRTDECSHHIHEFNRGHKSYIFDTVRKSADINIYREFFRRPKLATSLETMGMVAVDYSGLQEIRITPTGWEQRGKSLKDWHDFLKLCVDLRFRDRIALKLPYKDFISWLGLTLKPQYLDAFKFTQIHKINPSYVAKLLRAAFNLNFDDNCDYDWATEVLTCALNALEGKAIIIKEDRGYQLDYKKMSFYTPKEIYFCPITKKALDTVFCGLTPYLSSVKNNQTVDKAKFLAEKHKMPTYPADISGAINNSENSSSLREWCHKNEDISNLRNIGLWNNIHDRTIEKVRFYRVEEHSAQQSTKDLEKFEEKFKKGEINILNCSTTMEMGVDIGGISMVAMNNVPPHPANYLQRAGRSGRRGETRSLAFTICKNNPHDYNIFHNPLWAFDTIMPRPFIILNSSPLIQRHVNAYFLKEFLDYINVNSTVSLEVGWFFLTDTTTNEVMAEKMCHWLSQNLNTLKDGIDKIIKNTILLQSSYEHILSETLNALRNITLLIQEEYSALEVQAKDLPEDSPFKKKIENDKKRISKEFLLKELSSQSFLPAHGFPTRITSFNINNIEDYLKRLSREDDVFNARDLPSRDILTALREYAPSSDVIVNHKVYKSAGLSLNWKIPNGEAEIIEHQIFKKSWRCDKCGASGVRIESNFDGNCSNCGSDISKENIKRFIQPSGFKADFYDTTTNNIAVQKFIPLQKPWINAQDSEHNLKSLPNARIGHYISNPKGHIFFHSSGEFDKGYALCLACGRAESIIDEKNNPLKDHYSLNKNLSGKKEEKGRILCDGTVENFKVQQNLSLGINTHTHIFEVYLKNPRNNEYFSEKDKVICWTFGLSIRKALVSFLGIDINEIGVHVKPKKIDGKIAFGICLFDKSVGGYGFSTHIPNILEQVFSEAFKNLECPDKCNGICYSCLLEHDVKDNLEQIDRHKTKDFFMDLDYQSYISLPNEQKIFGENTFYCPENLEYYIATTQNIDKLSLFFSGNEKEWDIVSSFLKRSLHLYDEKIDEINIVIQKDIFSALPISLKEDLYKLTIGLNNIHIRLIESLKVGNGYILGQILQNNKVMTYGTKEKDSLSFNERWSDTSLLVASETHPQINFPEICDKENIKPQSQKEIEIITQCNGNIGDCSYNCVRLDRRDYG